jgi:hypothetical protein
MPSHLTITLHGWTLWAAFAAAVCAAATVTNVIAWFADAAEKTLRRRSLPAAPCVPADVSDVLAARAWGDGIPGIREDALRRAHDLFGPDARLEIEQVRDVGTSIMRDPGPGRAYHATVIVRRVYGGDQWLCEAVTPEETSA